jgi:lysophospholipase L1-like esterase
MPAGARNVAGEAQGRVARTSADGSTDRYQWPGIYFEARFKGQSVYFRTGPGDVILHALVDGASIGTLVKPAPGTYRIDGLSSGEHTVRIDAVTESQAASNVFGGFALPAGAKALRPAHRSRQIEFIGDSHTVGYGNTSTSRDCTQDEVWATTDNSQSFGPKVARHYGADYQINAISGRGIVRNYGGSPGDPLPVAYPFVLFEHSVRYEDAGWRPQIIVIALGTNDFSTPLNPGEKWATRAELHADYETTYVTFIERLRARNPRAFIILWATDIADHEIQREADKVVGEMRAKRDGRIAFLPINALAMTGCHWHPSVADHDKIAMELIRFIDDRHLASSAR